MLKDFTVEYRRRVLNALDPKLVFKLPENTSGRFLRENLDRSIERASDIRQWKIHRKCRVSFGDHFSWRDLSDLGKDSRDGENVWEYRETHCKFVTIQSGIDTPRCHGYSGFIDFVFGRFCLSPISNSFRKWHVNIWLFD